MMGTREPLSVLKRTEKWLKKDFRNRILATGASAKLAQGGGVGRRLEAGGGRMG